MKRGLVFGVVALVCASVWVSLGEGRAAPTAPIVVAVGDGWLSGVGAGALRGARSRGVPALVASGLDGAQRAYSFAAPGEDTASVFDHVTGAGLAPALATGERLRARDVLKPLVLEATRGRGPFSQIDRALARDPDFLLVWLGNTDALRLVSLRGEEPAPLEPQEIGARMRRLLAVLAETRAHMVVANVVDPTRLPIFRAADGAVRECRAADGEVQAVPSDALVSLALDHALLPVPPCSAVTTAADRARVRDTIAAYNAAIADAVADVARERGAAIATVDAFALVERLAADGLEGYIARDGLHPGPAGRALMANAFLDAMSAAFGAPVRHVDVPRVGRRARGAKGVGSLTDDPSMPQRRLLRLARRLARDAAPEDDTAAFTPAVVGTPSSYLAFSGLETGDPREIDELGNCAIVGTPTCTGLVACQMPLVGNPTSIAARAMNVPEAYVRAYHRVDVLSTPSPTEACSPINGFDTNQTVAVCAADVCVQTNGQVRYRLRDRINGMTVGSPTVSLPAATWRRVEMRTRLRTGTNDDECEFRLDGSVVAASSTLNLGTSVLTSAFLTNRQGAYGQPNNAGNWTATFDDVAVTVGVWPGPGRVIARQGRAGTPTYAQFSLVGGSTIEAVWSDTGSNSATRAQSVSTLGTHAQTMLVAPFDVGFNAIGAGSTPSVCQTWLNANTSSNPDRVYSIRRRIGGVNTDVVMNGITTEAEPFSDGILQGFWSAPLAGLNGAEIGAVKTGSTNGAQLRVNDAWLSCEYEPPTGEAACAQPIVPGQPVMCAPNWSMVPAGQFSGFNNYADGVRCTTGAATGYTVQSCSIAVGTAPSGNIRCAIYTDVPDPNKDALCSSASTPAVQNSVNTLPVAGCPTLSPNTSYWIVWNTSSDQVNFRMADNGCSGPLNSSFYVAAPYPTGAWAPDPWGNRISDTCRLVTYMSLLPVGGPTTTSSTSTSSTSSTSTSSSTTSTSSTSSTTVTSTTSTSTTSSTSTSSTSTTSTSSSSTSTSSTSSTTVTSTTSTSSTSSTSTSTSSTSSTSTSSTSSTSTSSVPVTTTSTTIAGLVAAYGFNENIGNSVADLSGRGNNGVITGATWTTAGRFGNALVFNGTSNFVNVADSASLDLTTALTIEAYVFPTVTPSSWRALVAKEQAGGLVYFLHASNNLNRPFGGIVQGGIERTVDGTATLAANAWTHVATTYDGANQRLYVNGTQVAVVARTGAIDVSTGALRIGGTAAYGEFFQGRIDEVRVYNRALSATEINADLNRAVP